MKDNKVAAAGGRPNVVGQHKKGLFGMLFGNCTPEDPLDRMQYEYERVHDTSKSKIKLGFKDPEVKYRIWRADAAQKSAIYDQFYTFMCWGCPVAVNMFCVPCYDFTELEEHMKRGDAIEAS